MWGSQEGYLGFGDYMAAGKEGMVFVSDDGRITWCLMLGNRNCDIGDILDERNEDLSHGQWWEEYITDQLQR